MRYGSSSNRVSILYLVVLLFILSSSAQVQLEAAVLFEEHFDSDVIGSSDWVTSDNSVSVDSTNGWLHISADGDNSDYASKDFSFTLPVTVEIRMRLVSGGQDYTLPSFGHFYGPTNSEAGFITYLPEAGYGWHFLDEWTDVHLMGPMSENVWLTVKVLLSPDGGELWAKTDTDFDFTHIATRGWSIPGEQIRIRLIQSWDSVCDFDYIVISAPQSNSTWCDDFENYSSSSDWSAAWFASGNVAGITIDSSDANSGSKSLKMTGQLGSCWAAIVTRPVEMNLPKEIGFAVKNGSEVLSGCHQYRAVLGLHTGPSWQDCPCPQLVRFLPNGDIELPLVSSGVSEFSGYALETWHQVRCVLSLPGDDSMHVSVWANADFLREFTIPEETWMTDSAYVDISSQEGTAWFDDVCLDTVFSRFCCYGETGDINADGKRNLTDLTLLVNHLFVTFAPLTCLAAGNTSGDAACVLSLTDLTLLVNSLFVTFEPTAQCGDFDPMMCVN